MALRGRGSGEAARARAYIEENPREMPWEADGLSRPERVIAFMEFLPITKGILAGQPMELLEDQKEFIRKVYGDLDEDGRRKITMAIDSKPRGNGKTGMVAGLGLCHMIGPEAEPRGEIYSASINATMAEKIMVEMSAIIRAVPEFLAVMNENRTKKTLEVMEGPFEGTIFHALSADKRQGHGLAPSLWIYDELAQASDSELLENLMTAQGKRKESLGLIISTQAETDDHFLSKLIDDGLTDQSDSTYVQLLAADPNCDPFDEDVLRAVNPAFGHYLDLKEVMEDRGRAMRMPAMLARFKNRRLNQRVDLNADKRICSAAVWSEGNVPVDPIALRGRTCYGGLDLSKKKDLTAFTLVFPDRDDPVGYDVLSWFWTPSEEMPNRKEREQERFQRWIDSGHLELIDGPIIEFEYVAKRLMAINRQYNIASLAYDRWKIDDLKREIEKAGGTVGDGNQDINLTKFNQSFSDMGPACEYMADKLLTGKVRHGGNPVLTASVASAIVVHDPHENMKFDKEKSHKSSTVRIDGAVSLAMALGMAQDGHTGKGPSVYQKPRSMVM